MLAAFADEALVHERGHYAVWPWRTQYEMGHPEDDGSDSAIMRNNLRRTPVLAALLLAFSFGCSPTEAQGQTNEIDSLLGELGRMRATGDLRDTAIAKLRNKLVDKLSKAGEYESALKQADASIALLNGLQERHRSHPSVQLLLAKANRLGGRAHYFEARYAESLKRMQAANRHALLARDTVEEGRSLMYMAFCFREMQDTAQAISYSRRAIALLERTDAQADRGTAIMSLGGIYSNVSMVDSSAMYFHRALELFLRIDARSQIAAAQLNLVELYNNNGLHDSVDHYLEQAAPYVDALNPQSRLRYKGMLGRSRVMGGRFQEGLDLLAEAEAGANGNPADLAVILHLKALAYAGLHDMPAAMAALRAGDDATVEDLDLEKVQEVTALRMAFEQEREAALAQERIAEEQERRKLAYVAAALLGVAAMLLLALVWVRSRSARALRLMNAELLRAQGQLVQSEKRREAEQVRTRIARDIHDDMGGELTKIRLLGGEAQHLLRSDPGQAGMAVERMARSAQLASDSLRDIVWATDPHYDTRQGTLDHARDLIHRMLEGSGPKYTMDLQLDGPDGPVDTAWKQNLIRILKEALNNALKHAQASRIDVTLLLTEDGYRLTVQDDGRGLGSSGSGSGHGLRNMRARAASMGARFDVSAPPEGGCRIELHGTELVPAYH